VSAEIPEEARDISKILSLDEVYNIGTSFSLQPGTNWQRAVRALNHKHVLKTWSQPIGVMTSGVRVNRVKTRACCCLPVLSVDMSENWRGLRT
jgi:hypothetical protein